jgi:membrane-associated phospholipid phosphatase
MNFKLSKIFDYIGYSAPIILGVITLFFTLDNKMTTIVFAVGSACNLLLNNGLKIWLKQPRPTIKQHSFASDFSDMYNNCSEWGVHEYGMPSGHAQVVWFNTIFIALALNNNYITLIYAAISTCSMIQRVQYNNHSLFQVLAGMVVGAVFVYFLYSEVLII